MGETVVVHPYHGTLLTNKHTWMSHQILYAVERASFRRLHSVRFHLQNALEMTRLWEGRADRQLSEGDELRKGGAVAIKAETPVVEWLCTRMMMVVKLFSMWDRGA